MKVVIQGGGPLTLTQKDFLASGGEGSVWVNGTRVIKVYSDPKRMLPIGKITELRRIQHPNVITPQDIVLDTNAHPIGYTMRFVQGGMPLCQIFTRAFREREGLDHGRMTALVQQLRVMVESVHRANVLIVDLNEMNFLVGPGFKEVFGIDADSYQTEHYPATALMPSVKDWTATTFTEGSDWFSFACVAFQMFVGIHPFKGKHPTIHGLEERMKASVSVLDSHVTVPKVVYPFNSIPSGYLKWFKAVFEQGLRLPPPQDPGQWVPPALRPIYTQLNAVVTLTEKLTFSRAPRIVYDYRGTSVSASLTAVYDTDSDYGVTPKHQHVISMTRSGEQVTLRDETAQAPIPFQAQAEQVRVYAGRIYLLNHGVVSEITFVEGAQVVAAAHVVAQVMPRSSRLFLGCVLTNALGSIYASLLADSKKSFQVRLPELDGRRILEARFDRRVLMTLSEKAGSIDRHVFLFDSALQAYTVEVVSSVTPAGLNFVMLGDVLVHMTEDDQLVLRNLNNNGLRTVSDPVLGNDLKLFLLGGRVGALRGDTVYELRVK